MGLGLGGDLAGLRDVLSHLLHQLLGRVESDLVAQALEEIQATAPPVQIALEADQVRLDPQIAVAPRTSAARRC